VIDYRADSRCAARSLAEPRTQKCQSPPVRAGHDHPAEAGELSNLTIASLPQLRPVSQALFLAVGMLVPASSRRDLGTAKEQPSYAH
jgi:hypothetical protein